MKRFISFLFAGLLVSQAALAGAPAIPPGPPDQSLYRIQQLQLRNIQLQGALPPANPTLGTITVGANNGASTINGRGVVNGGLVSNGSPFLTWAHATQVVFGVIGTGTTYTCGGVTIATPSTKSCQYFSIRFITDSTAFDILMLRNNACVALWVDGVPQNRGPATCIGDTGQVAYVKFDITNGIGDTQTVALSTAPLAVASGGSGYALGDFITLNPGVTCTVYPIAQVTQSVSVLTSGGSVVPVTPGTCPNTVSTGAGGITQLSTTGSGSGATFTSSAWIPQHTIRTPHKIELKFTGGAVVGGMNFTTSGSNTIDLLEPWPLIGIPTLWVGDSFEAGTNSPYPGSEPGILASEYLGQTNSSLNAVGGTGFQAANGSAPPWGSSQREADILTWVSTNCGDISRPCIIATLGGINDALSGEQTAVTNYYNTLFSGTQQNIYLVNFSINTGAPSGASTATNTAIHAGFTASQNIYDPTKIRSFDNDLFANNVQSNAGTVGGNACTAGSATGSTNFYTGCDGTHGGLALWNYLGHYMASQITEWANARAIQ